MKLVGKDALHLVSCFHLIVELAVKADIFREWWRWLITPSPWQDGTHKRDAEPGDFAAGAFMHRWRLLG
jgi:hypothetical protein